MKIPVTPPELRLTPDILTKIFQKDRVNLSDRKYQHWDTLRHRTPPDGFSVEEWWFAIKLSRVSQYKQLSLLSKEGEPFVCNKTR